MSELRMLCWLCLRPKSLAGACRGRAGGHQKFPNLFHVLASQVLHSFYEPAQKLRIKFLRRICAQADKMKKAHGLSPLKIVFCFAHSFTHTHTCMRTYTHTHTHTHLITHCLSLSPVRSASLQKIWPIPSNFGRQARTFSNSKSSEKSAQHSDVQSIHTSANPIRFLARCLLCLELEASRRACPRPSACDRMPPRLHTLVSN